MTILGAACALVDDIVESGSFLRSQVSACDYGIMEENPACAVTIRPANSTFNYIGYGNVAEQTWGFSVRGWIKSEGDVEGSLADVFHMHDALYTAINGGSNANNSQYTTRVVAFVHNQDSLWNFGGPDYQLVEATVTVREDP